jgi:chromosome partitioning protein
MLTYALVNQKGGVGKTTTAISLGAHLARRGQKVLIVDGDPQANATSCLGIEPATVSQGAYEAIMNHVAARDCVLRSAKLGLAILPSSPALAGAQIELVEMIDRESALRSALQTLNSHFDYILIDCPPSLGLLTVNGLVAAISGVIIPVQCEYLALEGLSQLMATLQRVRSRLYPALSVRGLLLTMFDTRTRLSREVADELRAHFGASVFETVIPRSVRLAEAPSHGLPITAYAPESPGAIAYGRLADELLARDLSTSPVKSEVAHGA